MPRREPLDRLLPSLYEATLDEVRWPAATRLIDKVCGATGSSLIVGDDAKMFFAALLAPRRAPPGPGA